MPGNRRAVLAALVLCLAAVNGFTLGSKDASGSRAANQKKIEVQGRVRLVGTDLFSNLVITDEKGRDWYVDQKDRALLNKYEQRRVTVTGSAEYRDLKLANGKKVGVRHYLLDITLVEPR